MKREAVDTLECASLSPTLRLMHHTFRKSNNDKKSWSWGFFGVLIPMSLFPKLCEQQFLRMWENYRKWTKEVIGKGGVDFRKRELIPKDLLVVAHTLYMSS